MVNLIVTWLVLALAVFVTAKAIPGVRVTGFAGSLWVAAIFGALNWLLGWLLFHVIGIATLGLGYLLAFLTAWLVNAILFKLTDAITDSLSVRSFGAAALAALCIAIVVGLARLLFDVAFQWSFV